MAKIKVDSNKLKTCLQEVSSVVGKGTVSIYSHKDELFVEAENTGVKISKSILCEPEDGSSIKFMVDNVTLSGIVNNRGEIYLTIEDNQLLVKSVKGRYQAKIGVESFENKFSLPEGLKLKSISGEIRKLLVDILPRVVHSPVFSNVEVIPVVRIKVDKKESLIACFLKLHGVLYKGKGLESSIALDIPISMAGFIQKFLDIEAKGKYVVDNNHIYFIGDVMKLRLTYIEAGEFPEEGVNYIVTDKPKFSISTDRDTFLNTLNNMVTLHHEGSALSFDPAKNSGLKITSKTETGSIQETLKVKISGKVQPFKASLPVISLQVDNTEGKNLTMGLHSPPKKDVDSLQNMIIASKFSGGTLYNIGVLL